MQVTGSNNKISIQAKPDGFTIFNGCARSEWLGADCVFTSPALHRRYDDVEISIFTPKFTLVPTNFFRPEDAREMLSQAVTLTEEDSVGWAPLPQNGAVAIYSLAGGGSLARILHESVRKTDGSKGMFAPEQYFMLRSLEAITEYNKIVASYAQGWIHIVVAQGKTLLLCNSFEAPDFTTAEYFIFMVMRRLQLNPEVSTIHFRTPLEPSQEESLYGYFHSVEAI